MQAEAAQGVEIALDGVAAGVEGLGVAVGEALAPEAPRPLRRHGPAGAGEAGDPGAAPVLGQMNDQVITTLAQLGQQRPFRPGLGPDALHFPAPVDAMQFGEGRMMGQHGPGFLIDQGIDFAMGRGALEGGEHRRRQQHVAVVA